MLRTLRIRDFVIIDDLTVEFGAGLNLLTGETGAGKSILVDALGLLSGMRADRSLIRTGCSKAVVEALFEVDDSAAVREWAAECGVEVGEGGQILVQRELPKDGNGKIRINGSPSTVNILRELGARMVELHGQHEQHSLMASAVQLRLLDDYGGHGRLLSDVSRDFRAVGLARKRLDALRACTAERHERRGRLEETVREIESASPRPGEIEELDRDRTRLQNAETISRLLQEIIERSYEAEDSAAALAAVAARRAEELARLDPTLEGPAGQLRSAAVELDDAGSAFRDYRDRATFDPDRLEELEARKAELERLCLRFGADEAGLVERLDAARKDLEQLRGIDGELREFESACAEAEQRYVKAAAALSEARRTAADRLGGEVESQLRALALPAARFEVAFRPSRGDPVGCPENGSVPLHPSGAERAELRLAANPGEEPAPLAQAASGGELSRVLLALHVVGEAAPTASTDRTLVFDEVDAGVSGAVADAVGARLARLARRHQLLCVTHLPQVAAYADRHFRVSKRVSRGRTLATIDDLTRETRIEELARMLGGKRTTETSRKHAAEMLGAAGRARPGRRP